MDGKSGYRTNKWIQTIMSFPMQKNSRRWSTDVEWTEEVWDLSPVKELVIWWVTRVFFFCLFFCICFYHIPPSTWVYIWMGDGRKKKPPDLSIWWSQRRCDGCSSSESLAQMFVEYDNDCNASPRLESELCLGAESQIRMQPRVRMQLPIGLRYFRVHLESRLRGEKATPTTT